MYEEFGINLKSLSIDEIYVGRKASFAKTISEHDVYTFAGVCGDFNPIHINAEYAKNTFFGERIAHGMLTASLYSTVIGMALPGCGTIFMEQSCKFLKPVKFGDTVTALAEVVDVKPEKRIVKLKVSVVNQNEETVIDGDATVMAGKSKA